MAKSERNYIVSDAAPGAADVPRHLTKQEFGRRVYTLMIGKGWRQAELARQAGIERNSVGNYVRGRAYPSRHSLEALAKALGVKPDDLLPNYTEAAIKDEAAPDFAIKTSLADPSKCWLTVNRLVSTSTAVKIAALLEEDRAA